MSRPLRIEYDNAFYHVMNRGRGRENIFLNDNDFEYFLHSIEQASLRFKNERGQILTSDIKGLDL